MAKSNLRKWAKDHGVDYELAREYQRIRKRWNDNTRRTKKQYGYEFSFDMPDIRSTHDKWMKGDINQHIREKIDVWKYRNSNYSSYLNDTLDRKMAHLYDRFNNDGDPQFEKEIKTMVKKWDKATTRQKTMIMNQFAGKTAEGKKIDGGKALNEMFYIKSDETPDDYSINIEPYLKIMRSVL